MPGTFDQHRDLFDLFSRLDEGQLGDDESSRLRQILLDDADSRRLYRKYMTLVAGLHWVCTDPGSVAKAISPPGSPQLEIGRQNLTSPVLGFLSRTRTAVSKPILWSILGVGLLFCGYVGAITWGLRSGKLPRGTDGTDSIVAVLGGTAESQWSDGNVPKLENASIKSGEPLKIDSGLVEVKLTQGATLLVAGPASWSIDSENSATLRAGKLVAKVPRQAVGFTLNTPSAQVVDLGTEFGLEVTADGVTEVHVLQGSVDLFGESIRPGQSPKTSATRLRAGEAAHVQTAATNEIEFRADKFARSIDAPRPETISHRTRRLDLRDAVATQSSTWSETPLAYAAAAALDGKPQTASNTSGQDELAWWQVDLGKSIPIAVVVMHNRSIARGWLRDLQIKVLADDQETVVYTSDVLNAKNANYGGEHNYSAGPDEVVLDLLRLRHPPVTGRFLRIERIRSTPAPEDIYSDQRPEAIAAALSAIVLAEVEVYESVGVSPPKTIQTGEVAP